MSDVQMFATRYYVLLLKQKNSTVGQTSAIPHYYKNGFIIEASGCISPRITLNFFFEMTVK